MIQSKQELIELFKKDNKTSDMVKEWFIDKFEAMNENQIETLECLINNNIKIWIN